MERWWCWRYEKSLQNREPFSLNTSFQKRLKKIQLIPCSGIAKYINRPYSKKRFLKDSPNIANGTIQMEVSSTPSSKLYGYLEPPTTIYKWLFQLDDSQSLHRKWLFHQISIFKWLFGVPGTAYVRDSPPPFGHIRYRKCELGTWIHGWSTYPPPGHVPPPQK